ncbi:hypothetical protein BDV36DRAFT_302944 [Aspergillus pseudocaelatus]|uniref:Uncharacterized protein n=1 Tax=Aspergillus pseudocaelatus TaxID=1825620 RepID=A0ABQ6VZA1_9EURO|nr:hypothetical protein BDV36DRAFT_302944 [Aspergillus pseudocaelatus]
MAHIIFQKLDGLPVIICKVCQYGVWPNEIVCYLKGSTYRKSYTEAVQIQETIQQWENIAIGPEEIIFPYQIDQAWPELPIYPDGLLCRRDYPRCRYIGRTIEKRVTREQRIQGEAELRQSYILVNCQQIFPTRKGSHYIHVRGGETELYIPVPTAQVDEAITAVQQAVEAAQQTHIQSSSGEDIHDANLWLRVTRWTQYLQDFTTPEDFSRLRELVETPLADSNDPVEQGVRQIWEAIEGVVRKSQQTVQHTGQAIRVEAPWQQIVAFIARTQTARGGEQERKYPAYRMTPRQPVLGRGEFGWRDPESYPPILSRVIKIIETWQQPQRCAEWTLQSTIPDIDSAYGSDSGDSDKEPESVGLGSGSISSPISPIRSQDPPSRIQWSQNLSRKIFQEQITYIVSYLMIRRTYTPMETLQDWRIYGLKIYYNITAPGHVMWIQPDRLLYNGYTADFEPGAAVRPDPSNPVAHAVRRSHTGHRRMELFAGLPDPIAGRRTHMTAGAGAGRAGYAEAVYPPPPAYAVPAQVGDTVSTASSPIQGEASRAGLTQRGRPDAHASGLGWGGFGGQAGLGSTCVRSELSTCIRNGTPEPIGLKFGQLTD